MARFNVKATSQLTGVSEHLLRAWERRYEAVMPSRSETGRRFYTHQDISRIRLLKSLVDRGHAISSIANLSLAKLQDLLGNWTDHQPESHSIKNNSPNPETQVISGRTQLPIEVHSSPRISEFMDSPPMDSSQTATVSRLSQAIEDFDIERLVGELHRAQLTFDLKSFCLDIIRPTLAKVGECVQAGKWTIAQEHVFSAAVRDFLGQIMRSVGVGAFAETQNQRQRKRVILATPEGDLHEFGTLLSAILFGLHGYSVHYLGPNVPVAELTKLIPRIKPQVLVIGMTKIPAEDRKIDWTPFFRNLLKHTPPKIEILVGGTACQELPTRGPFERLIRIQSLHGLHQWLESSPR